MRLPAALLFLFLCLVLLTEPGPRGNPLVAFALKERSRFSGVVLERLDAGPYEYLRVQPASGDARWVATLSRARSLDLVDVTVIAQAARFESRRLHRTFSSLSFAVVTPRKEVP
jgi:hypothetical protein